MSDNNMPMSETDYLQVLEGKLNKVFNERIDKAKYDDEPLLDNDFTNLLIGAVLNSDSLSLR